MAVIPNNPLRPCNHNNINIREEEHGNLDYTLVCLSCIYCFTENIPHLPINVNNSIDARVSKIYLAAGNGEIGRLFMFSVICNMNFASSQVVVV